MSTSRVLYLIAVVLVGFGELGLMVGLLLPWYMDMFIVAIYLCLLAVVVDRV